MRPLLDTYTFLWMVSSSPRLSMRAVELFRDPDNEVFLSAVSAWEIAVKCSLRSIEGWCVKPLQMALLYSRRTR